MSNNSKLKHRIYTGSILALLVIAGIFWLPLFVITFIMTLILMVAVWEWTNLIKLRKISLQILVILFTAFLFLISLIFFQPEFLIIAAFWWFICFFIILFYPKSQILWKNHIAVLILMGILTLVPFALAIVQLCYRGPGYLLLGFFIVWAADSGAYLVGRRFGRHKLAAHISPNKTIEGFLGGMLFTLVFALMGCLLLQLSYSQGFVMIVLAILTNFASVIGDLFESMIKRYVGVKDSGHWLPGHGGLLDRIDSLTCALPIFAMGLKYFLPT